VLETGQVARPAAVRIEPVDVGSAQALDAVIAMSNLFRDRLGQLPYAVFTEAAEQSRLLVVLPTPTCSAMGSIQHS
jgi:hypothetical protein